MSPSFIRWAGRQLRPILDWQTDRRVSRLCPQIAAARSAVRAARRRHKAVRPAMKALRDAVNENLMKGLYHG